MRKTIKKGQETTDIGKQRRPDSISLCTGIEIDGSIETASKDGGAFRRGTTSTHRLVESRGQFAPR